MALLSRFITLFVLFAALQIGLAGPPCKKKPSPSSGLPSSTPTVPPVVPPTTPTVPPTTPETPPTDNTTTPNVTPSSDVQAALQAHNTIRSQHGAADLTWSDALAAKAQEWAARCVFEHSGGQLGPYGENLAASTGLDYDMPAAVKSWADEAPEYDPNNPQASHFTQIVWKATTQVGCALHTCSSLASTTFTGPSNFIVCEYNPPGNYGNQYSENVQV